MPTPITLINDADCQSTTPDPDRCFGSLETTKGHLPLEAMDVRSQIVGLSYKLSLRQTFVNNLGAPLEATYIFPLPPRAAVTEFRLRVGDREVVGEIEERGKARAAYNQAISSGHRAAIAEEDRSGVFNLRVGNLMPGDRAVVELVLSGPLELEGSTATFRFPLVVAPRYMPGQPLEGASVGAGSAIDTDAVPDASRISPPVLLAGYPNPVRLSVRLELDSAGLALNNLRCALHAVVHETRGTTQVIEVQPGERLNRDFIVRFDVGTEELTTSLFACPDANGEGGTFCLTAVPPKGAIAGAKPRDVVFVLDRSGSMSGWKMVAARRACARMIDTLTSRDQFSVLAFDNSIDTIPGTSVGLLEASDRNRFRAIEFLATLDARGGTEMHSPLLQAAKMLGSGYKDRERVLVLVTDGQVGNEDQILRDLSSSLGARVFTVGIDRAVNEGFLRRLAALGAGACSLVESEDRLDEAMDTLARRISEPVITELSLRGEEFDIDLNSVVPRRLPDLFAAAPFVIHGRYRGSIQGALTLSGVDIAGGRYERSLVPSRVESSAAASIWARGRIRVLEDAYAIGSGDKPELAREIIKLSLTHRVLSRFTAFVAVDEEVVANPGGKNIEVVQPVELPEGWAAAAPMDLASQSAVDGYGQRAESAKMEGSASMSAELAEERTSGGGAVNSARAMPTGAFMPAQAPPSASPRASAPQVPHAPPPLSSAIAPKSKPMPMKPASPSRARKQAKGRTLIGRGVSAATSMMRRLGRNEPAFDGRDALVARIEQLSLRHQGRAWLDAALRRARVLIELAELVVDLRSLGADRAIIESVESTRRSIESDPSADVPALLAALARKLELESAAPVKEAAPARDGDFWR